MRWSAPLVQVVHDLAAAATLGALVTALLVVRAPALRILVAVAAQVWALTALVGVALTFADAAGLPLWSTGFVDALLANAWALGPTRIGLINALAAGGIALAALALPEPSRTTLATLLAVAVLAAAALGLASHTGTSADHETSVNAMAVHIVAAGTWVGGLIALLALRRAAALTRAAVSRWSTVALWCFCAVAVSGIIAATTRLGPWSDLTTPYGRLLVVKAVGLLLLGWAGWAHRRSTIRRLERSSRGFWGLVLGELAVMATTVGVATALSRSAPPVPEEVPDPSPTLALTGYPAPPPPDAWSWRTTWRIDWLLLAVAVVAIGTYASGLVVLRRSGRAWPGSRTTAWVVGWVVFVVATSGGPGTYGRVALSWHVALVLVELLVVPALLVLAEPISLARHLAENGPGRSGSPAGSPSFAGLFAHPLVAVGVAVMALIALVLGPGLDWTLETHPGHVIVSLALPLLGSAVVASIRAAHRDGERTQTTAAMAALAGALTLLGIALVLGSRPLAGEFFERLQLPWLTDLIAEQRRSGLVVWAVGAIGLVGVLANLATTRGRRVR